MTQQVTLDPKPSLSNKAHSSEGGVTQNSQKQAIGAPREVAKRKIPL
jgi:hypothetical protein